MYEGYKRTNIKFDKISKTWNMTSKSKFPQSFVAVFSTNDSSSSNYPIGRNSWSVKEVQCGIDLKPTLMALSACNYPT